MAMSRSIGASSLITLPSIETSPELIASSPAIILSVVVLPQPDGPTNTTTSLSRLCRLTSLPARTLSYNLLIPLSTTSPIPLSALYPPPHSSPPAPPPHPPPHPHRAPS